MSKKITSNKEIDQSTLCSTVSIAGHAGGVNSTGLTGASGVSAWNTGLNYPYLSGSVGSVGSIGTINSTGAPTTFNSAQYYNGTYTIGAASPHPLVLQSSARTIVTLTKDGDVIWEDDATIDEAAEAFSTALQIGSEMAAGITNKVKQKMRDTVFEEMISLAKEKGSVSAEDLHYLWQAAKIIDKLKGKI